MATIYQIGGKGKLSASEKERLDQIVQKAQIAALTELAKWLKDGSIDFNEVGDTLEHPISDDDDIGHVAAHAAADEILSTAQKDTEKLVKAMLRELKAKCK